MYVTFQIQFLKAFFKFQTTFKAPHKTLQNQNNNNSEITK